MRVTMSLTLPGEVSSVRMARRVLASVLDVRGVAPDAVFDICLALAEACTNVVDHAHANNGYRVVVEVNDQACRLIVTDAGAGFRPVPLDAAEPPGAADEAVPDEAERGRGIQLIRALTDRVGISSGPGEGVIVFMEKRLQYA
jgi:serine/threonine-protein kinase RsbW